MTEHEAQLDRIESMTSQLGERCEYLAEALYCTGQIAVIHHTTVIRVLRLLRELNRGE